MKVYMSNWEARFFTRNMSFDKTLKAVAIKPLDG